MDRRVSSMCISGTIFFGRGDDHHVYGGEETDWETEKNRNEDLAAERLSQAVLRSRDKSPRNDGCNEGDPLTYRSDPTRSKGDLHTTLSLLTPSRRLDGIGAAGSRFGKSWTHIPPPCSGMWADDSDRAERLFFEIPERRILNRLDGGRRS